MEKIDRELLIKEISCRLPYSIKAQVLGWDEEKGEVEVPLKVYSINTDGYLSFEYNHYSVKTAYVEDCRLYLRPLGSMTEKEEKEYRNMGAYCKYPTLKDLSNIFDWLNAHHFDYRGLIELGLGIDCTELNIY